MPRTLAYFSLAMVCMVTPALSQTLVRDPQTGNYTLSYTDLNGTARTVIINAVDRVNASVSLHVELAGTSYQYTYLLANGSAAQQSVAFVDLLCPDGDPTITAGSPPSWNARAQASGKLNGSSGWLCSFSFRNQGAWVAPGSSLPDLRITSVWLPAVRTGRAYGLTAPVALPTLVEDTPDSVYVLVERAQGFGFHTGGGAVILTVVPARLPATLADPGPGLDSVIADLAQVCSVDWITSAGVCTSLGVQLSQARDHVAQGNSTSARTSLEAFLGQLNSQHGTGLPVNDNAYWLLKTNAEFVLGYLGAPATPTCFGSPATIYVLNGSIVGGPHNGQAYTGTLDGTPGSDVIVGTSARDIVEAGSGADKVCGMGGDDLIKGQGDADQLDGGDGPDVLEGGAGNDTLLGGLGNDLLKGQDGNDTANGGEGNDTIEGGGGNDDLDGGAGTDTLKGQSGTDQCRQGESVETCEGP